MAYVVQPRQAPAFGSNETGGLFNYDAGLEEAARATGTTADVTGSTPADENRHPSDLETRPWTSAQIDDVDEEVVVTRRRQPIAKLDEPRLLSAAGIPRLRKLSKQMRYKGKGHEFSDMAKMLHMYQLWLDDLYPRAKFADGLAILEKLGHKKTMHMYRKGWIDEGKPKPSSDDLDDRIEDEMLRAEEEGLTRHGEGGGGTIAAVVPQEAQDRANVEAPEDDELDALMAEGEVQDTNMPQSKSHAPAEPDEDELDALLAESHDRSGVQPSNAPNDAFADEEEAMAGMDW